MAKVLKQLEKLNKVTGEQETWVIPQYVGGKDIEVVDNNDGTFTINTTQGLFHLEGTVDNVAELPTNAEKGDVYYNNDDQNFYVFDGTEWKDFEIDADIPVYTLSISNSQNELSPVVDEITLVKNGGNSSIISALGQNVQYKLYSDIIAQNVLFSNREKFEKEINAIKNSKVNINEDNLTIVFATQQDGTHLYLGVNDTEELYTNLKGKEYVITGSLDASVDGHKDNYSISLDDKETVPTELDIPLVKVEEKQDDTIEWVEITNIQDEVVKVPHLALMQDVLERLKVVEDKLDNYSELKLISVNGETTTTKTLN